MESDHPARFGEDQDNRANILNGHCWPKSDFGKRASPCRYWVMPDDPQKYWDAYYERIGGRRVAEAALLWGGIEAAGATEETVFALDFVHFGNNRDDVDNLVRQLSEHYSTEVSARSEANYWNVIGATRPGGICLTKDQHAAWVEFMVDVARSYACVFAEWTLEAPALGRTFRSAQLDSE